MVTLDPQLNYLPEDVKSIHIMGICGTGMAALAGMLKASGYIITGSDANVYPPMSVYLEKQNIELFSGYSESNLSHNPDLVIVGNVITAKNPETAGLEKARLPYLSFPQALAEFFISTRKSLVISGTHGKTTSCSLLASTLARAEQKPTFMIGGIVKDFDANFAIGDGPYFIAEGDEYDTAFFDKESKFLHYKPDIAVITSIEFDHADIFTDLEHIKNAFRKFIRLIPENGLLIANYDDPVVVDVCTEARCEVQGYGKNSSNYWSLGAVETRNGTSAFSIIKNGVPYTTTTLNMAGTHNCLNGLAVFAVLDKLGIPHPEIEKGFSSFQGVKRRQEVRGTVNQITVIDDFAHHPTAVKETLKAIRTGYPGRRLIAVFEPRTNSSRRSIFQQDYIQSFDAADEIVLREPIPLTGVDKSEMFSSSQLAKDIMSQKGLPAAAFDDTDLILEYLGKTCRPGDVVAILSNGGFDTIHERLLTLISLQERAETQDDKPSA